MRTLRLVLAHLTVATAWITTSGCDKNDDQRLVEMAEQNVARQQEQNRRMTELQREIAQGARHLVEADAKARSELVSLQKDVQAERAEVGRQRDELESERRQLARQRRFDPIIATAITQCGAMLAAISPLLLCWQLLCRSNTALSDDEIAHALLHDLTSKSPRLFARYDIPRIGLPDQGTQTSGAQEAADPD